LSKVTWVLSGDEHVAEYRLPANVVSIEPGRTLEGLVESGDIAAAIGVQVDSPNVKPLIANAKEAGFDSLRLRGLYPINHTVVVRNDALDANPDLASDLFNAFAAAKRVYVDHLAAGRVEGADPIHVRVMELTGDPLPYGIEPNLHDLEAIVRYSVEQGILAKPFSVEELFVETTRDLAA